MSVFQRLFAEFPHPHKLAVIVTSSYDLMDKNPDFASGEEFLMKTAKEATKTLNANAIQVAKYHKFRKEAASQAIGTIKALRRAAPGTSPESIKEFTDAWIVNTKAYANRSNYNSRPQNDYFKVMDNHSRPVKMRYIELARSRDNQKGDALERIMENDQLTARGSKDTMDEKFYNLVWNKADELVDDYKLVE